VSFCVCDALGCVSCVAVGVCCGEWVVNKLVVHWCRE
jgi:hypothetical protein